MSGTVQTTGVSGRTTKSRRRHPQHKLLDTHHGNIDCLRSITAMAYMASPKAFAICPNLKLGVSQSGTDFIINSDNCLEPLGGFVEINRQ